MSASAIEKYRSWFEYEKDSHRRVLASLTATPDHLRSNQAFQKAVDLMAHIVAARWLWLYRFGIANQPPSELFPRGVGLSELSARVDEMQMAWTEYLNSLTETEVDRVFEYQSYEGPRFRNKVEDILTQLFGHSWYHRGQIALLLREAGAEPAVTDYLFWIREPL